MVVLLVGNYPLFGSTSMDIWAHTLERELREMGIDVRLILPRLVFGRLRPSEQGLGKWLGYIDRYLLFPFVLRRAAAGADVVHICDHGSAMYCGMLRRKPTVVTCHDMLAVRGALGELPEMRASRFGVYLQRWICHGLRRATGVACVSNATFDDVTRIVGCGARLSVILNALNYPFQPLPPAEAKRRLDGLTIDRPFLLHVGSNHPRKNRDGVLRVFARVAEKADLQLVFAGHALNDELAALARELGLAERIVQIARPDVSVIEALYNRAVALLFPSRLEGFGWPAIEAQACGCAVVASNIPPLADALRDSALLHSLDDENGMAASVLSILEDKKARQNIAELGLQNVRARFQTRRMMEAYVALYQRTILLTAS